MLNGPPYRGSDSRRRPFSAGRSCSGRSVAGATRGARPPPMTLRAVTMRRRRRRRRGAPPPGEPPTTPPRFPPPTPCRRGPDRSGRRGCERLGSLADCGARAAGPSICAPSAPTSQGVPPRRGRSGRSCAPPGVNRPLAMGATLPTAPGWSGHPLSARSRRTPWVSSPGPTPRSPVATMRPGRGRTLGGLSARSSTSSRLKWVIATTPSPTARWRTRCGAPPSRARRRRGPQSISSSTQKGGRSTPSWTISCACARRLRGRR